ncbi:hypothetical protein ACS0TY_027829 [Phlomoides rotata]
MGFVCLYLNSGKVVAIGSGLRDKSGNNIPVAVKEGDTVLLPDYGDSKGIQRAFELVFAFNSKGIAISQL